MASANQRARACARLLEARSRAACRERGVVIERTVARLAAG
jgi:hypothetical protein